jgi:small subunit ribosomal protein S17
MPKTTTKEKIEGVKTTVEGKTLSGVVVSIKMKDTVVVAVTRFVKHPKYRKFIKRIKKYHAHDAGNTKQVGDNVEIQETKPISKTKHFAVK